MLKKWHLILCAAIFLVPTLSWSMACHCYSQKNYDPNNPTSADPYLLATSQNSLVANVYNIAKKKIVIAKQKSSTTSERLWVAHWVAERTVFTPGKLLKARYRNNSWQEALATLQIDTQSFGSDFLQTLETLDVDTNLSQFVVDDVLLSNQIIAEKQLTVLRQMGSNDAETILSSLLALKTNQPASEFYNSVKFGGASWGSHLMSAQIDGTQMVEEIKGMLAHAPQQI